MIAEAPLCFDLEFRAAADGRSRLARQFARYPVHVGRALQLDDDPARCTVVLQSASGGLFESDRVRGRLRVGRGAKARVCSSAATIVHSMRGGAAEHGVDLFVEGGADLVYQPGPLILFPDSRATTVTRVHLARDACVVCCDAFLDHDPGAQGRRFARLELRVEVRCAERQMLLARDRMVVEGRDWAVPWGGAAVRHCAAAGLWMLAPAERCVPAAALLDALSRLPALGGVSALPNGCGLQVRLLAEDAVALNLSIEQLLAAAGSPALDRGRPRT